MKCPHCNVEVNPAFNDFYLESDPDGDWFIAFMKCPNLFCDRLIVKLVEGNAKVAAPSLHTYLEGVNSEYIVRPFLIESRSKPPVEVEPMFAQDYIEACLVFSLSPKASAALSRRCLQNVLREKAKVKKSDLINEIKQIVDSNILPSGLSESLDAVRVIGNFASHPIKSKNTGEIIDVEFGEAEWLLDVLESLFDFYFVQPKLLEAKKEAINRKLLEAGKPLIK
jgi:hypothetical protein